MPQLRILCWNIQDLGTDQVDDASFIDMMVAVIHNNPVDLVCILETKADEGTRLGGLIKAKLDVATAKTWGVHSSTKSGPSSNKPENYVFLWDQAVVTAAGGWKFAAELPKKGFINAHIKSRYPYLGDVTVNGKTITLIAFHTCFERVDIVECNQNLSFIAEISSKPNVILMGDFNDKAVDGLPVRRGRRSFADLYAIGATGPEHYACALDERTSLKTKKNAAGMATTADARFSYYDHFFWRSTGGQLSNAVGSVVDVIAHLHNGQYLHTLGKTVFNNWAGRKNEEEGTDVAKKQRKTKKRPAWVDIVTYLPADNITTVAAAHGIYVDGISDHLPVRLVIDVS